MEKWVNINERWPEEGQNVLFVINPLLFQIGGTICAGWFKPFDYYDGSGLVPEFATLKQGGLWAAYWMPVPELPEEIKNRQKF